MAFDASLWGQQATHTINVGQVPSSQSNVPILITKNLASFPSSMLDGGSTSALNGGGDIRVSTDAAGANQLPVEIVSCVTSATPANQELIMWVRVPTVNNSEVIYITWNRAGQSQPPVTDTFGRNAVWQDYFHVFHCESLSTADSTGNGTPVVVGGVTASALNNGYPALNFNGTQNTRLHVGNTGNILGDFTASTWVNVNYPVSFGSLISRREDPTPGWEFNWRLESLSPSILIGSTSPNSPTGIATSTDYLLGIKVEGSTISFYQNGALQGTDTVSGARTAMDVEYAIGGFIASVAGRTLNGKLANNRLRTDARGNDWFDIEYNNQSNQAVWATIGTPYVPVPSGTTGNLTSTLNETILSSIGQVGNNITGNLTSTLNETILSSIGQVGDNITGILTSTLDNSILLASGTTGNIIQGSLNVSLDESTLSSVGQVGDTITGSLNVSLDESTLSSLGQVGDNITGTLTSTLDNSVLIASGVVGEITGSLGLTLDSTILAALGQAGSITPGDNDISLSGDLSISDIGLSASLIITDINLSGDV